MFTSHPTYDFYRTLERLPKMLVGEDVFALQTALLACGFDPKGADGYLGDNTATAIWHAQQAQLISPVDDKPLLADGKAGQKTQGALEWIIATKVEKKYALPADLIRGQIQKETSFYLGAYTDIYNTVPAMGSWDVGVVQKNTYHYPDIKNSYDVPAALGFLGQYVRSYYDDFAGVPDPRRWQLAQGAWNRPAYAAYIAREEGAHPTKGMAPPLMGERSALEDYMSKASMYYA